MPRNFKLSPSDFSFLWQECPRCYYLKIVAGFKRPGGPFPSIFGTIDRAMRAEFLGGRTERMAPELPPGTMTHGEKLLHSAPIVLPGHMSTITLGGRLDAIVTFDDGSYGVIDFKTSAIKPQSIRLYSRQLRAYAYALENPAPGKFALAPISAMGLLAFQPETFHANADRAALDGALKWYPIKRNDESFMAFLDDVLTVLELPEAPPPAPKCAYCRYRAESRANGL